MKYKKDEINIDTILSDISPLRDMRTNLSYRQRILDYLKNRHFNEDELAYISCFLKKSSSWRDYDWVISIELFKILMRNLHIDENILMIFLDYIELEGWEYEAVILKVLASRNEWNKFVKFCLSKEFCTFKTSYFMEDAVWQNVNYLEYDSLCTIHDGVEYRGAIIKCNNNNFIQISLNGINSLIRRVNKSSENNKFEKIDKDKLISLGSLHTNYGNLNIYFFPESYIVWESLNIGEILTLKSLYWDNIHNTLKMYYLFVDDNIKEEIKIIGLKETTLNLNYLDNIIMGFWD